MLKTTIPGKIPLRCESGRWSRDPFFCSYGSPGSLLPLSVIVRLEKLFFFNHKLYILVRLMI